MSRIKDIVKGTFGSFRDTAAEEVVGDESVEIYSLSVWSGNAECGQDCHHVSAVIDGVEHDLGEVVDGDEANDEIARRVSEIV